MKTLNDQKDHQFFRKMSNKDKDKSLVKNDVYVTRYMTEWNSKTDKAYTTISGDQIKK